MNQQKAHTDYKKNMSGYLEAIERAVDACVARGVKTEFVMWHCPGWASESGKSGGWKPRVGEYPAFTKRIANHFKGRVDAYQLYHEVNLQGMMNEADMNFIMSEILQKEDKQYGMFMMQSLRFQSLYQLPELLPVSLVQPVRV